MSRELIGNALASLAIGAGVIEPAAYAQEGSIDAVGSAGAEVAADSVVLPDGGLDVSGLVDAAKAGDRPSTALAAALVAREDTCMGARTFGVQAIGFGLSVGTAWSDRQCRRMKNARQLSALGYPAAAIQLLCMDREVRRAMARAGTPCEPRPVATAAPPPVSAPPPAPPRQPPVLTSVDDVLFDFDRAALRPEAGRILDPVLAMLRADPAMRLDIEGHTDWVGSDAYNQRLSERRAAAVVAWFVARGVARERLSASGAGEGEPVASNGTPAGRQLNRRVELRRYDPPTLSSTNLEAIDLPTL